MSGRLGRVALGWLSMVLAVGCAGGSPPTVEPSEPGATEPATNPPGPSPTGSLPTPTAGPIYDEPPWTASAVTSTEAWGTSLVTSRLERQIGTDRHVVFSGVATADGRYLFVVDQPNDFLPGPTYETPSFAALYEVSTGQLTRIAELATASSQMTSASSDGEWVAWTEAHSRSEQDIPGPDWRLRAYNLATGAVTEVARAKRRNGVLISWPVSVVTVSDGIAVWSQTTGEPGLMTNKVVRQCDLATGRITTLARSTGKPRLSWPWIVWTVYANDGSSRVEAKNLETGRLQELDVPSVLDLDGTSAAFTDAAALSIWLVEDVSEAAPAVEIARGLSAVDHLEWPTLNDRIVGWSGTLSTVVYDRAERRLVALPMPVGQTSDVTMAGPLMVWAEREPGSSPEDRWSGWFVIANTDDLRILP